MSTSHQIATTLTKLGAVLIVVLTLQNLTEYLAYVTFEPDSVLILAVIFAFNFALPLMLAYLLWTFPRTVAGIGSNSIEATEPPHNESVYLNAGLVLLGIYTFIFGVIDLIYFETHRYINRVHFGEFYGDSINALPQDVAGRITNIVQILFGLVLILGRSGIVALILRARHIGADR